MKGDDLSEHQWRHVALAREGAELARLYIDGGFVGVVRGESISREWLDAATGNPIVDES
jgi:hypothetical protein